MTTVATFCARSFWFNHNTLLSLLMDYLMLFEAYRLMSILTLSFGEAFFLLSQSYVDHLTRVSQMLLCHIGFVVHPFYYRIVLQRFE